MDTRGGPGVQTRVSAISLSRPQAILQPLFEERNGATHGRAWLETLTARAEAEDAAEAARSAAVTPAEGAHYRAADWVLAA